MDPLELVRATGDAAFAADKRGRIVAWNAEAERLLGYSAAGAIGRPCFELLCGLDVFGNPYCNKHCVLLESALNRIPLRRCELSFKTPCGEYIAVTISTLHFANSDPEGIHIIHLMSPVVNDAETANGPRQAATETAARFPALTARESQVLRLISEGHETTEIASLLNLGATTIRTHLRNVRAKLEVRSTLDAACVALRNGLI